MNAARILRNLPIISRSFVQKTIAPKWIRNCSSSSPISEDAKYEESIKQRILDLSLDHVPQLGWSISALEAGATSLGYPGTIHGLFPRGEGHLVHHLTLRCNKQLIPTLTSTQLTDPTEYVETALRNRLQMLEPWMKHWAQALAISAKPDNAQHTLAALLALVDDICWYAGDRSVDTGWYMRRIAVAFIFKSTELYMVQDRSPGFENTWKFLNRQLSDAQRLYQGQLATQRAFGASADIIASAFTTARNMLGLNATHTS